MSENKRALGSDLNKVDAHEITPEEYEEAPELDADWFAEADLYDGGKLIRRGRPRSESPKRLVSLRLSPKVLEHFRAGGPGWQTRINDALLAMVEREPKA